jgi:hypothetical protein
MDVFGSLNTAGYEVVSSLPVTNLFNGRFVILNGTVYVYQSGTWTSTSGSAVIPPQTGQEGKFLQTQNNVMTWQYINPTAPVAPNGLFLKATGQYTTAWADPFPDKQAAQYTNPALSIDSVGNIYWGMGVNPDLVDGKFLTNDGTGTQWANPFPTDPGENGYYLTMNQTTHLAEWQRPVANVMGANLGDFLKTDGVDNLWAPLPPEQIPVATLGGQILYSIGGVPVWQNPAPSVTYTYYAQYVFPFNAPAGPVIYTESPTSPDSDLDWKWVLDSGVAGDFLNALLSNLGVIGGQLGIKDPAGDQWIITNTTGITPPEISEFDNVVTVKIIQGGLQRYGMTKNGVIVTTTTFHTMMPWQDIDGNAFHSSNYNPFGPIKTKTGGLLFMDTANEEAFAKLLEDFAVFKVKVEALP